MRIAAPFFVVLASLALSSCIARTAASVVTAPVRVASKAVDVATTSQSEADENRGREIRKREEKVGKLERKYDKQIEKCREGDDKACDDAQATYAEIQEILPTIPVEPNGD